MSGQQDAGVTDQAGRRLWEIAHPNYCATGNYFNTSQHFEYGSWQEFHDASGDIDVSWNLVFRWDWRPNDGDIDTADPAALREYADRFGDRDHAWTLQLFRIIQSNGIFQCTEIQVCKDDEPAVRAWLAPRAEHLRTLWQPLLEDAAAGEAAAGFTNVQGARIIATVYVVDAARDLTEKARAALFPGSPEHDFRLVLPLPGSEASMHRGATADDVVEYLQRDRQRRDQGL